MRQAFELSDVERVLLVLYHAVPVSVRAELGQRLFFAWTHPPPSERATNELRYQEAAERFDIGQVSVEVFADLEAGTR